MSKALLLIHGFLTCTDDWDELLPALEPLYDKVVLFKQPGHERKGDMPHFGDFTEKAVFDALDGVIEELEPYDSVDVAGHSMGGGAAVYACAQLKNVRKGLLYAPAFRYPRADVVFKRNAAMKKLDELRRACGNPELTEALDERVNVMRDAFAGALDVFFRRLLPHWSLRNIFTFAKIMRRAAEYLPRVACPLCIMWGSLDEFIPFSGMRMVMESVSSDSLYFIRYPDADHALMYLGDISAVARDTLCYLTDGNLLDAETRAGEARMCYRIVRGKAGAKFVTVSRDERGVELAPCGARQFRTVRTDTYTNGGGEYYSRMSGAEAADS